MPIATSLHLQRQEKTKQNGGRRVVTGEMFKRGIKQGCAGLCGEKYFFSLFRSVGWGGEERRGKGWFGVS